MAVARTAFFLLAISAICWVAGCTRNGTAVVVDHQTEGNLESKNPLGCIDSAAARSTDTPADLYQGVAACVAAGNLENATLLYALAGTYGRFDMLRVTDRSAHQAITVLQMQALGPLPKEKKDGFQQATMKMKEDPARLAASCAEIRRIGPPDYVPRYMIQHGMGAFLPDNGNGLDEAFDGATAWEQTLTSYLNCPAGNSGN